MIPGLNFMAGAFGLKGMAVGMGITAVAAGWAGWELRDVYCDAAALKVKLHNEASLHAQTKQDLDAAVAAAQADREASEAIAANAAEREERIRELEGFLRKVPADKRCTVDPARLKRLLGIAN